MLETLGVAVPAEDLTTLKGTTYRNFTVVKADQGFLTINYDEGTASLKAEVLPEAIRKKYGLTDDFSSAAPPQKYFSQLVLKDSSSYFDVKVVKVEPDGLTILHRDGGSKIPFEKLPDAICKLYGLTSDNALAYRATIKPEPLVATSPPPPPVDPSYDTNSPSTSLNVSPTETPGNDYVYVHGYYRKNGTYVNGYYRRK